MRSDNDTAEMMLTNLRLKVSPGVASIRIIKGYSDFELT
jgi:hypothetical protein